MITDPNYFLNDKTYKDVIIQGSEFPKGEYKYNVKITLNKYIQDEFIPTLRKLFPNITKGHYTAMLTHAYVEGFYPTSRAYENNNPGNIGNTDGGSNNKFSTLEAGIIALHDFLIRVGEGKVKSYPMGKELTLKPFYSKEIAKNCVRYQKSPWCPGYRFVFDGRICQFLKIYATGPRSGHVYENAYLTMYKQAGFTITVNSKIQDLIKLT